MRIQVERDVRDSYIYLFRNSYILRIKSADLTADRRNLLVKFIVLEKGVTTELPFSLEKQNLWKLRELLEACGKQVPHKSVKINLTKLVGLECGATLIDDGVIGFIFSLKKSPTVKAQRSVDLSPIEVLGFECVDCGSRHFREVLSEENQQ